MDSIKQLGLAPAPWKVELYNHTMEGDKPLFGAIFDSNGTELADEAYQMLPFKEALLMSKSPELWESLRLSTNLLVVVSQFVSLENYRTAIARQVEDNYKLLDGAAGE